MPTIIVRHHSDDVLAAEIIAGALISIGRVFVISYPPGPQRIVQAPLDDTVENLVLWTHNATDDPGIVALMTSLASRRAPCTALLPHDVEPPTQPIDCATWPLFDRSTAWTEYRSTLRERFGRGSPHPPQRWAASAAVAQFVALRLPGIVAFPQFVPALLIGGVLVWALLR